MLKLDIRGVNAYPLEKESLTAGRIGLQILFTFSDDWKDLSKIAIFEGAEKVELQLANPRCVVPEECLKTAGPSLRVGVYGIDSLGTVATPTVWANFGQILSGAQVSLTYEPGVTPPMIAQILSAAQSAVNIANSVRRDADAGKFDGATGPQGATGPDGSQGERGPAGADGSKIWNTTVEPLESMTGTFTFRVSDLSGASGTPAVGDLIFYGSAYYPIAGVIVEIDVGRVAIADTRTSIRGATGPAATDEQVQTAVDAWLEEHPEEIAEQVQDAVDEYLSNHPTVTGTFTNEAKNALLTLLEKVAYTVSDGQTYLDALRTELFRINVDSISAVFTQGSAVIYDTDSLDTLKQYLVVTANYSDGTSGEVTTYTLSGTLEEGTSTITVSYGGKTATFTVTVVGTVDVTPSLSQFTAANASKTGVAYNSQTDSLHVYTLSDWQYVAAEYVGFTLEEGYEYLMQLDLTYASGVFRCGFVAGNTLYNPYAGPVQASEHIEFVYPYDSEVDRIKFFVTWGTSIAGDCTISNFKVIKRPVSS